MRSTLCLSAVGFAILAAISTGACGDDDTGTGGAGATGSTQSTSTGMDTTSSTGGSMATGGGMGGMMGTGGAGGMMGTGGMGGMSGEYQSCGDCTDGGSGAPTKECKAQFDACQADADCTAIYDCSNAKCTTDGPGGCCSVKCWMDSGAAEAKWNLFKAYDDCVYCSTCKALCSGPDAAPVDATAYCANTANNGAMCPP
ncbi:MAG: hypothetical protein HUU21_02285 [Polyangiaceae bacterium]|nr:hypothetical protein [Polyangiaceae bacterium]